MLREILHIDMDAFFASVEQRDKPELRGKPIIVGAAGNCRGVVCTCSYEARKFGVRSAMPSSEAFRRCPTGIFIPPDLPRYRQASRAVFSILSRFSPVIEPLSCDEAFLDLTGCRRLFGEGPVIATEIRRLIREETNLTASVGVAGNKFLAKLGSDENKPDGLFVVPSEPEAIREWLAPKPVHALWGVGKVLQDALNRAGYRLVRDIQTADIRHLSTLLQPSSAENLMRLSFGVNDEPVISGSEEKSVSREHTFPEDCTSIEELEGILKELVDAVGRRLRISNRYAQTVRLKIRWDDFSTITRQNHFLSPVCDDRSLMDAAFALFQKERLKAPVRLIGFGVSGFIDQTTPEQPLLFEPDKKPPRKKCEQLAKVADSLRGRFGDKIAYPGRRRPNPSANQRTVFPKTKG